MWPSGECQPLLELSVELGEEGGRCLAAPVQAAVSPCRTSNSGPRASCKGTNGIFFLIPIQQMIKQYQAESVRLPATGNKPLAEAHIYTQPTRGKPSEDQPWQQQYWSHTEGLLLGLPQAVLLPILTSVIKTGCSLASLLSLPAPSAFC